MNSNVCTLVVGIGCVLLTTAVSSAARAATVAEIATCRKTVTGASSRYASKAVSIVTSCHGARIKGRVPEATDCNDVLTAAAALGKSLEASLFDGDLGSSGQECESVSPAEASYTSCPAPCDSTSITDWPAVDTCMRCLLEAHVESLGTDAVGQSTVPLNRETQRCAKALHRLVSKTTTTYLDENARCLEERGRPNDCLALDTEGRAKVARARGKGAARVSKSCAAADHASLGGCATGPADIGCVLEEVDRHAPIVGYDVARMLGDTTPAAETFSSISSSELRRCGVASNGIGACWQPFHSVETVAPGQFTRLIALGQSGRSVCGLRPDGSIDCWGPTPDCCGVPPALDPLAGPFEQISGSEDFACGIRSDGTLACWGSDIDEWLDAPPGNFTSLSAGLRHSCAIRIDGTAACWGDNAYGESTPPSGTFLRVSAGYRYSCGIRADQTIECWGDTGGNPTPIAGTFTRLSVGSQIGCGVRTDASLECWNSGPYWSPAPVTGTFTDVEVDRGGICALRTDGALLCQSIFYGDFEKPDPDDSYKNVSVKGHSCAVRTNESARCWGFDTEGQVSVPSGSFVQVSAGGRHTCGLHTDQTLECWGYDASGQATPPPGNFLEVSVGRDHSCAIAADSTAVCWGEPGSPSVTSAPSGPFVTVSGGGAGVACGLRPDSSIECWGSNWLGQASPPTFDYASVSLGESYGCATTTKYGVVCWGSNQGGESAPPSAGGPYDSVAVSEISGVYYTCGLRTGGTLDCWPYGAALPPPGVYTRVAVGEQACAIRDDGRLVCWSHRTFDE